MSIANQITARLRQEARLEREAAEAKKAAALAAGPPAGSRIDPEAWSYWHRFGFVVCPGRAEGVPCYDASCRQGADCIVMAAKGLHGDGASIGRKHLPRCGAKTRAGGACAMSIVPGKHRCRLHGGLSTGPSAAGRQRLSEHMRSVWAARKAGDE